MNNKRSSAESSSIAATRPQRTRKATQVVSEATLSRYFSTRKRSHTASEQKLDQEKPKRTKQASPPLSAAAPVSSISSEYVSRHASLSRQMNLDLRTQEQTYSLLVASDCLAKHPQYTFETLMCAAIYVTCWENLVIPFSVLLKHSQVHFSKLLEAIVLLSGNVNPEFKAQLERIDKSYKEFESLFALTQMLAHSVLSEPLFESLLEMTWLWVHCCTTEPSTKHVLASVLWIAEQAPATARLKETSNSLKEWLQWSGLEHDAFFQFYENEFIPYLQTHLIALLLTGPVISLPATILPDKDLLWNTHLLLPEQQGGHLQANLERLARYLDQKVYTNPLFVDARYLLKSHLKNPLCTPRKQSTMKRLQNEKSPVARNLTPAFMRLAQMDDDTPLLALSKSFTRQLEELQLTPQLFLDRFESFCKSCQIHPSAQLKSWYVEIWQEMIKVELERKVQESLVIAWLKDTRFDSAVFICLASLDQGHLTSPSKSPSLTLDSDATVVHETLLHYAQLLQVTLLECLPIFENMARYLPLKQPQLRLLRQLEERLVCSGSISVTDSESFTLALCFVESTETLPLESNLVTAQQLFWRKWLRLSWTRMNHLLAAVPVEGDVSLTQACWHLWIQMLLLNTASMMLLPNRHIDSLLLCTCYAVFKVNGHSITFRSLVSSYSKLSFSHESHYKHILLDAQERGDVIAFYNQVYLPLMKDEIIALKQHKCKLRGTPPAVSLEGAAVRISRHYNVYVSPLRPSSLGHGTPARMRALYEFGTGKKEEAAEPLRSAARRLF